MRSGLCYVLEGKCRYSFDEDVVLTAGHVAKLPEGKYTMEVLGDRDLRVVLVWELPVGFRGRQP